MYLLDASVDIISSDSAIVSSGWRLSELDVPNLGITDQARWVRFDLQNRSSAPRLVVQIPYPELDEFLAYRVDKGASRLIANIGQAAGPLERIGTHREMAFDVDLPPDSSTTILLKLISTKQLQIPVVITTLPEFNESRSTRNLFIGGYLGIMMVLALYNLFVFFSIRDRSYLYYVLYILCLCFAQMTLQGVTQAYFWSSLPWFSTKASVLFTLSSMLFAGSFIQHFINTKRVTPRLDKWLKVLMIVIGGTLVLEVAGVTILAYKIAQALSGSYSLFIIILAITAIRSGSREARFFLLAWAAFLIGVVAYILKDVGILPLTPITQYAMPVGSVVEGILLSFGLADRINILRREKEASQAEALAASMENERIIREQNVMLESKVKERTHALQESNENLKQTQSQLVNAEKMASLGQLTAGIAHEINNPINFITSNVAPLRRNIADIVAVIKGYQGVEAAHAAEQLAALHARAEQIGLDESIAELDDIIASIAEGSSRTAEIVRGLRNFSRLDEDDLKDADINDGLRSTLTVLGPQHRDKVSFNLELGDIPKVECFPGKVNQVFMNIMTNAVQATLARTDLSKREVTIRTSHADNSVSIRIADNGVGMSDAVKARVFEPFFTTKGVGEGTGLGMAIVYGIINDHGGSIAIDSMPGAGTEFTITLPLRQERRMQKRA
jgi:two-component system NtrC family sensor kinase